MIRNFFSSHVERVKIKGSFVQNVAITFSGNVTAQVLGVLFTPFVARVYGPEAYGVFVLFIAIVNNLSPLSTLQLPSGYVTAENDHELYGIIKITIASLLFFTCICSGFIFFFGSAATSFFNVTHLSRYLFLIPLYCFLMGIDNILLGWNIRLKEFKRGAVAKVSSTVTSRILTLILGILNQPSAAGIILGNLITYPIESVLKLSSSIRGSRLSLIFHSLTWAEWRSLLKKYWEYIFYVTPGVFVSNFSSLLPIYCFSFAFNDEQVGYFALANSLVTVPLTLVVNSSITVFLQKAAETINQSKSELSTLVYSLYRKLFFVGFIPLAVFAFSSRLIFSVVLGSEWEEAGRFASFLCLAYSFTVVYGPLSVLFRLLNHERYNFAISIIFFGLKLLGLWIGVINNDIDLSIVAFSFATLLYFITSLVIIFRLVGLSLRVLIKNVLLVTLFAVIVIWFNSSR